MKIRIEPHTLLRQPKEEQRKIKLKTLEHGLDLIAKNGRLGKGKVFDFRNLWNGKFYEEKKIEVFYVTELETIITVTVYVFNGNFKV